MDAAARRAEENALIARFTAARLRGDSLTPEEFLATQREVSEELAARLREVAEIFRAAEAEVDRTQPRDPSWMPTIGARLGGFRILRRIGQGGMGVVFEAEELEGGRHVALKVLAPELRDSKEAEERFRREARIAASLSHPRCVFVYGVHDLDNLLAISMELVEGGTLQEQLSSSTPIPIETAVRWTLQILEGLEQAHRAGIVHRDLKPSNCFLTEGGDVKVGDFGLSRLVERDLRLTVTGKFIGSPFFAAPEQVVGREIDARVDVYATGATLYALLVGKPPHTGDDIGELLGRILTEKPVPPRELRAAIPRGLQRLVLRALAKDPSKRFASASEFARELQAFVTLPGQPASFAPRIGAYLVDWVVISLVIGILRATLSLTVYIPMTYARNSPSVGAYFLSFSLHVVVTWLYFTLLEWRYGASLGKWLMNLRVNDVESRVAGLGAIALRSSVLLVAPSVVGLVAALMTWRPESGGRFEVPAMWLAFFACMVSMRRSNGWRGAHEFASGTRVVRGSAETLHERTGAAVASGPTPRGANSISPFRVGHYGARAELGRTSIGRMLLAHDDRLHRDVWLHETGTVLGAESREPSVESTERRARRIEGIEHDGNRYEVFEAVSGEPLLDFAQRADRVPWTIARGLLADLADELSRCSQALEPSRVWIDVNRRLRIIEVPIDSTRALDATKEQRIAPGELVQRCARALLRPVGDPERATFPRLPTHGVELARRCCRAPLEADELREVAGRLRELLERPAQVTRRMRATQIALYGACCGVLLALFTLVQAWTDLHQQLAVHLSAQSRWIELQPTIEAAEWEADRDARNLLIANLLAGGFVSSPSHPELQRDAQAQHPDWSRREAALARTRIVARADTLRRYGMPPEPIGVDESGVIVVSAAAGWIVLTLAAILSAFVFRGGVTYSIVAMHVLDRHGARASRLLCAWRAVLAGGMPAALCVIALRCADTDRWRAVWLLSAAALALVVAGAIRSLLRPDSSWQDKLAGTHLVPH